LSSSDLVWRINQVVQTVGLGNEFAARTRRSVSAIATALSQYPGGHVLAA